MNNSTTTVTVNNGEKPQLNSDAGSQLMFWILGPIVVIHIVWPGLIEAIN